MATSSNLPPVNVGRQGPDVSKLPMALGNLKGNLSSASSGIGGTSSSNSSLVPQLPCLNNGGSSSMNLASSVSAMSVGSEISDASSARGGGGNREVVRLPSILSMSPQQSKINHASLGTPPPRGPPNMNGTPRSFGLISPSSSTPRGFNAGGVNGSFSSNSSFPTSARSTAAPGRGILESSVHY